jgi:ribosome-associated toxin RatA of RatAB toxin-antitoxin module
LPIALKDDSLFLFESFTHHENIEIDMSAVKYVFSCITSTTLPFRGRVILFLACMMLNLSPAWGNEADAASKFPSVYEKPQIHNETSPDGTPGIRAYFQVEAETDVIYQTLCDSTRFPEFMPDSREVCILESGPNYQIGCFSGVVGFINSKLTLKRVCDDATHCISWSMLEGIPRSMTGYWLIENEPNSKGSLVTYVSYVDAGPLLPDGVVRNLLRSNINQTVANLRKRVKSDGTWMSAEYLKRYRKTKKPFQN